MISFAPGRVVNSERVCYCAAMLVDPYTQQGHLILPSVLSANFARLGDEISDVLSSGADFLHMDVMDGHFAPNISFGPHMIEAARSVTTAYLDTHMMLTDPYKYAPALVKAGASSVTFHIEAVDDPVAVARKLRQLHCRVGVTLKPPTAVETVLPVLDEVDLVLVMSVEPGFSGQKFMPEVLPKIREIKKRLRSDQRLEIDGGMNTDTIATAAEAGIDWFVVGSAVFDHPNRAEAIAELRDKLK